MAVGAVIIGLLVWGFIEGRRERSFEAERERPLAEPSRVVAVGGHAVVVLDAATQAAGALVVTAITPVTQRARSRAYGTVVDPQRLIEASERSGQAAAAFDKAQATRDAAQQEYTRMHELNLDDRNVSAKTLQAAEAAARIATADLRAAQAIHDNAIASVRGQWGPVVSQWLAQGQAPGLTRLLAQQEVLVQVSTSGQSPLLAGGQPAATVRLANGESVPLRWLSTVGHTDPRVQGTSAYYLAPASGLLPGMNVEVWLESPRTLQGVLIPSDAVVWWQGQAWIYTQTDATHFVRVPIPTDQPANDGWFVPEGSPLRAVTGGAQLLFSEEQRAQVQIAD